MHKLKNLSRSTLLVTALSIVLVAALMVGATLAFLTDVTESRVNNFTLASPDLSARLVEPNWDGIVDYYYAENGALHPVFGFTDAGARVFCWGEDGNTPVTTPVAAGAGLPRRVGGSGNDADNNPANNQAFGREAASLLYPGVVALKNPTIYNTGTTFDIWVAVQVSIVYPEGHANAGTLVSGVLANSSLQQVLDVIAIDWNVGTGANQWTFLGGAPANAADGGFAPQQTLLFNSTLDRAAALPGTPTAQQIFNTYGTGASASAPAFRSVSARSTATTPQMEALDELGGFAIFVEGFAVQSAAAADFDAFYDYAYDNGVVFTNSPTFGTPHGITPR